MLYVGVDHIIVDTLNCDNLENVGVDGILLRVMKLFCSVPHHNCLPLVWSVMVQY
jgi:hypothetical protein